MKDKVALIILDGWGIGQNPSASAISLADTHFVDSLTENVPYATLLTHGENVGLPARQMGNSEVGHMNIGAGRIVAQDLLKINQSIENGEFSQNKQIKKAIRKALTGNKTIHLLGLVSDGGVHSHIQHLLELCKILAKYPDIKVYIHAFTDGRDSDPHGGLGFIKMIQSEIQNSNAEIVSVIGRYYAMDRDNRWERVKKAYDLIVKGKGIHTDSLIEEVEKSYHNKKTDEFILPIKLAHEKEVVGKIKNKDVVIFFNYRNDRPRELTQMLTQSDMSTFDTKKLDLHFVTMTEYDPTFENIHVIFKENNINLTLGEVISNNDMSQLRIAESEKYPHVTYFLSGGREKPFIKEARIVVDSPKEATYDLIPEMSCEEVTNRLIDYLDMDQPNFICLNYANADMVGHTGVMAAAIRAAQYVDQQLEKLVKILRKYQYEILIIADHGNSDIMKNPDGSPHTKHTKNPVPIWYIGSHKDYTLSDGILADVAPTVLSLLNIKIPHVMEGNILLTKTN